MAAIKGKQLADAPDGVSAAKLNTDSVTSAKILADAVTTVKILDANITAGKLATDSVTNTKIQADAVTTAKILDANITAAKLATDSVTAIKIQADAVTTVKILDANITTAKLAAGVLSADAAGRAKIASGFFDTSTVNDKFAAASIATAKLADGAILIKSDGSVAFAADQSHGGFKITNLADPTAAQDAATKAYVDNAAAGLSWKDSVRAATTVNGALATAYENGDVIDGVTLVTGNRILLKNQTTVSENGIYTVNASGAPTRATDADAAAELSGAAVFIEEGTAAGNSMWTQTGDNATPTFTTHSTWVQFAATVTLTAGAGLLETGSTWSIELTTDAGLEFDAGGDAGKLRVKLDGDSISRSTSGIKAGMPSLLNKDVAPSATASDNDSAGVTIGATPAGDSHVRVMVNGIAYTLGDGVKTKDCYFAADAVPATAARAISAIVSGDFLHWVGSVAGFQLATSDRVDFDYNVA